MVVIPILLFPVLFKIMFSVQRSQEQKAQEKVLYVACVNHGNAERFVEILEGRDNFNIVDSVPEDSIRAFLQRDELDGAYVLEEDFDEEVASLAPGRLDLYFKSTDDHNITRNRLTEPVEEFEEELLEARFESLELDQEVVDGVNLKRHNVASMKEQVGKRAGGFLPYIFILFCFMGAMYPAIDLAAGEKERGTLETLLTAPVNRFHILLGKFGVVVLSGLLTATISMFGLYLGFKQAGEIPPELLDVIIKILGVDTILLVLSLLLPLTVFFAGVLLSISLPAKSFKEAQSFITPLNIVVIIPAAIGMIPGITMNFKTALIPVLNVSLATKEIIAGTMTTGNLIVVYISLISYALLSLGFSALWFKKESTIFRS
jgi:sodium transport system permease protein